MEQFGLVLRIPYYDHRLCIGQFTVAIADPKPAILCKSILQHLFESLHHCWGTRTPLHEWQRFLHSSWTCAAWKATYIDFTDVCDTWWLQRICDLPLLLLPSTFSVWQAAHPKYPVHLQSEIYRILRSFKLKQIAGKTKRMKTIRAVNWTGITGI